MALIHREQRKFSPFFTAACEEMFRDPLYNHLNPNGGLELLLWSDNHCALREWLTVAASCGCMYGVKLSIRICGAGVGAFESALRAECPMFDEVFSRSDTADIAFSETPDAFPAYIACTPEHAHQLPAGACRILMREQPASGELVRLAENLHYTFSISYGSRDSLDKIIGEMHADDYSFHSSLLQAAHLPVKLRSAGADSAVSLEDSAGIYTSRIQNDKALFNRLVYLEHTRWTVFMCLCGWRMPSEAEMESYAFAEPETGNMITEFRHRKALLHPALAACSPEGVDALDGDGGRAYWEGRDPSALDDLSRVSLWQHRYVKRLSEVHREEARRLIRSCRAGSPRRIPELDQLEGAVNRVQMRFPGADFEFQKALELAKPVVDPSLCSRVELLMKSSIEAARRRSYLQGDVFSTRTIGFVLLFRRSCTRIVRALCGNAADNVSALMRLDPEKAVFITGFEDRSAAAEAELRGGVETFIRMRNLRTTVLYADASAGMVEAFRTALREAGENAVVDVTGAPPELVLCAMDSESFIVRNGRLASFRGCSAVSALNALPRELLVADVFAAMDLEAYEGWNIPDMTGIERLIAPAFRAYLSLTEDEQPESGSRFSGKNGVVQKLAGVFGNNTYIPEPDTPERDYGPVEIPAEIALNRNVTGCLRRLNEDGFIRDLQIETLTAPRRYSYRFRSVCWVHANKQTEPLLDILLNRQETDYTCSVQYKRGKDKEKLPQLKIIRKGFRAPAGTEQALEIFRSAGCFDRTGDEWQFTSAASRGLFAVEGNILEDYVWAQVRKNPHFKDVQLSYSFGRVSQNKLEQEVDVIAMTRNNRPVMFSCKLGGEALKISAAREIANHCRIYSMNRPIPVLVTACPEAILKHNGFDEGGESRRYVAGLGVHFVNRSMLGDEARFQQFLNSIAGA